MPSASETVYPSDQSISGSLHTRFNILPETCKGSNSSIDEELISCIISDPELDEFFNINIDGVVNPATVYRRLIRKLAIFDQTDIEKMLTVYRDSSYWQSLDYNKKINSIENTLTEEEQAEEKREMDLRNEYGIPIEFDSLYQIICNDNGDIKRINLIYERIADKIIHDLNVIYFKDYLFTYKDGIYREGEARIKAEIVRIVRGIKAAKPDIQINVSGADKEVMYYIRYDNPCTEYPFNKLSGMMPVNNGILKFDFDKKNVFLIPFDPKYRFTYKIPVNYDPNANQEPIDHVLKSYVDSKEREGENDKGAIIKIGYSDVDILYQIPAQAVLQFIVADTFKKAYLLQGDANAGKTTYLHLLYALFGEENTSGVPLQTLANDRFSLSDLEGKILNCYDDLSEMPLKEVGKFKSVTGTTKHRIDRKGKQAYDGEINAVHIYTCNTAPDFNEAIKRDTAFWERWEFINFFNLFDIDPFFKKKIFTPENLSGFLNGVIKNVFEINKKGRLLIDSTAGEVQEKWQYNADPLYRFLEKLFNHNTKNMYVDKEGFLGLYRRYSEDMGIDSIKVPRTLTAFTQLLHKYDIVETKKTVGVDRKPVYCLPYSWKEHNGKYYINALNVDAEQNHF